MSVSQPSLESPRKGLVWELYQLAKDRNEKGPRGSTARQRLAELRAGASFTPQGKLRMLPALAHCTGGHLAPSAPRTVGRSPWVVAEVVAALFAMAPEQRLEQSKHRGITVAQAFGRLPDDQKDSAEKRLLALVNTPRATLPTQLRHAIRLLDSKGLEFDWHTLPDDLAAWGYSDRRVQERWLRQFYGAPAADDGASVEPDVDTSELSNIDQERDESED